MGRLSGYRYGSSPNNTATSRTPDRPLPPRASLQPKPPLLIGSVVFCAPTSRQVSSGLYLDSSRVVGSKLLIALIRLFLLGPISLIPLVDAPATLRSISSRVFALSLIAALVVLAASSTLMIFWA